MAKPLIPLGCYSCPSQEVVEGGTFCAACTKKNVRTAIPESIDNYYRPCSSCGRSFAQECARNLFCVGCRSVYAHKAGNLWDSTERGLPPNPKRTLLHGNHVTRDGNRVATLRVINHELRGLELPIEVILPQKKHDKPALVRLLNGEVRLPCCGILTTSEYYLVDHYSNQISASNFFTDFTWKPLADIKAYILRNQQLGYEEDLASVAPTISAIYLM